MKKIELDEIIKAVNSEAVVTPLYELLGIPEMPGMNMNQIVVTNKSGYLGSAVIVRRDVQEKLEEKFGGSFLIIPSSIHELICVPDDDSASAEEYRAMIKQVNDTEVSEDDRLSYELFRYDADTKTIEMVA